MKLSDNQYRRWHKMAVIVANGNVDNAEEVLHNVVIELIKRVEREPSFELTDNYVFKSLRNRYLTYIQNKVKHENKFLFNIYSEDNEFQEVIEDISTEDEEEYNHDRDDSETERIKLIEKVGLGLSFFDKQLFIMHYIKKIPQRQISRESNITLAIIHQRLKKIKYKINEEYEKSEYKKTCK